MRCGLPSHIGFPEFYPIPVRAGFTPAPAVPFGLEARTGEGLGVGASLARGPISQHRAICQFPEIQSMAARG